MATGIKANAIYRVISQNCWMVPSDSSNDMYKVCFNSNLNIWECECRHGQEMAKVARNAHCKHVQAVQISIKANLKQVSVTKPVEVKGTLNRKAEFKMEAAPSGRLVPMR